MPTFNGVIAKIMAINPSSVLLLLCAVGLQMITMFMLARELGASEFGYYAVYTSIVTIFVEVIGFGAGELYLRNVVLDNRQSRKFAGHALATSMLSSVIFFGPVFFVIDLTVGTGWTAFIGFFIYIDIVAARLVLSLEQFFIAHHRSAVSNLLRAVFNGSRLIGVIVVALVSVDRLTLSSWLSVQASIAACVALIFALYYIYLFGLPEGGIRFKYLRESIPLGGTQVLRIAHQNLDRVLLLSVVSASTIGVYSIANRLAFASLTPTISFLRMKMPSYHLAATHGWHNSIKNAASIAKTSSVITLLCVIALVPILFIIEFIIGDDFTGVAILGLCLSPSLFLIIFSYIVGDLYFSLGFNYCRLYLGILGLCLYVCLVLGLGYALGLAGVLIAINVSLITNLMLATYVLAIKSNIHRETMGK